jgi:hypothetical protein
MKIIMSFVVMFLLIACGGVYKKENNKIVNENEPSIYDILNEYEKTFRDFERESLSKMNKDRIIYELIEQLTLISENDAHNKYTEYERILETRYPDIFTNKNTFEQIKHEIQSRRISLDSQPLIYPSPSSIDEDESQKRERAEYLARRYKKIAKLEKIIIELEQLERYKFKNNAEDESHKLARAEYFERKYKRITELEKWIAELESYKLKDNTE